MTTLTKERQAKLDHAIELYKGGASLAKAAAGGRIDSALLSRSLHALGIMREAGVHQAHSLSSPEVCDFMVRRARAGVSRRKIRAEIRERFGIVRCESSVSEKINRLLLDYEPGDVPETVPEISVDRVTFQRDYQGRVRTHMTTSHRHHGDLSPVPVTLPAFSWDKDGREWSA